MRTYNSAKLMIDGKETASLEIFKEHNIFHIFEYGANVFTGGWGETIDFIEKWKEKNKDIADFFRNAGHSVEFTQTIK